MPSFSIYEQAGSTTWAIAAVSVEKELLTDQQFQFAESFFRLRPGGGKVPTGFSPTTNMAFREPLLAAASISVNEMPGVWGKPAPQRGQTVLAAWSLSGAGPGRNSRHGAHFPPRPDRCFFGQRSKPAPRLIEFAQQDQEIQEIRGRAFAAGMAQDAVAHEDHDAFGRGQKFGGLRPLCGVWPVAVSRCPRKSVA